MGNEERVLSRIKQKNELPNTAIRFLKHRKVFEDSKEIFCEKVSLAGTGQRPVINQNRIKE